MLASRRRRQRDLREPFRGWLGQTPRTLEEHARAKGEADAVDDDRRGIGRSSTIEIADDDVEPIELGLVILVDRGRERGEARVGMDRADDPDPCWEIGVGSIEAGSSLPVRPSNVAGSCSAQVRIHRLQPPEARLRRAIGGIKPIRVQDCVRAILAHHRATLS